MVTDLATVFPNPRTRSEVARYLQHLDAGGDPWDHELLAGRQPDTWRRRLRRLGRELPGSRTLAAGDVNELVERFERFYLKDRRLALQRIAEQVPIRLVDEFEERVAREGWLGEGYPSPEEFVSWMRSSLKTGGRELARDALAVVYRSPRSRPQPPKAATRSVLLEVNGRAPDAGLLREAMRQLLYRRWRRVGEPGPTEAYDRFWIRYTFNSSVPPRRRGLLLEMLQGIRAGELKKLTDCKELLGLPLSQISYYWSVFGISPEGPKELLTPSQKAALRRRVEDLTIEDARLVAQDLFDLEFPPCATTIRSILKRERARP